MPDNNDAAVNQAFDALDRELGAIDARAFDPKKACEQYRKLKPWIEKILAFIEERLGPKGKIVVKVIRFLMQVADIACPAK